MRNVRSRRSQVQFSQIVVPDNVLYSTCFQFEVPPIKGCFSASNPNPSPFIGQ